MSWHINHFDTKCDEECEYSFNRKIADICVDTVWSDVIDVEFVGTGLNSARIIKILLELTAMNMEVVLMTCFPQDLVVLVWIRPDHKANKSV